jgi:DNA invertase Pin-like site-specific DNA recombinase
VAFIANLIESKFDFLAVDNPHANPLIWHLLAAFAEHERKQISARTKEALQAAKRRGVQLGKHGPEIESKKNRRRPISLQKLCVLLLTSLHLGAFQP